MVNKSPKCSIWMQSQKWQIISVCFEGKTFNITVIQLYAPTRNAEEAETEWFYGEGNGTPLQYSCLENPRDGGAWWATVYGTHRVGLDCIDLA